MQNFFVHAILKCSSLALETFLVHKIKSKEITTKARRTEKSKKSSFEADCLEKVCKRL